MEDIRNNSDPYATDSAGHDIDNHHGPLSYAQKMDACKTVMTTLDQNTITPHEALDRVLFAYNALPDYGQSLDPRVYELLDIETSRTTATTIGAIAEKLEEAEHNLPLEQQTHVYNMSLREFAKVLEARIEQHAYSLYGPLMGQRTAEDARSLSSTPHNPHPELYKDNSTALSATLLEEQVAATSVPNLADFVDNIKEGPIIEPHVIVNIINAQDAFYGAHELLDTEEKKEALQQVLSQLDDIEKKLGEQHLPIARAIVLRLSAQGLHDIGKLSNDTGMERDCIVTALDILGEVSPVDLSKATASSSVNRAIRERLARSTGDKSNVQRNMSGLYELREKIGYFIHCYEGELRALNQRRVGEHATASATLPRAA